jgi:hypothetical protein
MNTTLTPTTRQTTTQQTTQVTETVHTERRVGIIDRAALHLGMALIRWGRRPGRELARHERRANRLELGMLYREQELARVQLERERDLALSLAVMRAR